MMESPSFVQFPIAVFISSLIAIRSYRRKSLDLSGGLAGFIVMTIHFAAGYRYGALLLVFFLTSSKLTKVGQEKKRQVDAEFKDGGQRNWQLLQAVATSLAAPGSFLVEIYVLPTLNSNMVFMGMHGTSPKFASVMYFILSAFLILLAVISRLQVLSNSGIASILVVILCKLTGSQDKCLDSDESAVITALIGGIIGHYCCCNGDTWSSELGVLSDSQPRLITTFKPVRRGTNGGVTFAGLLAAAAAGGVIGLTFVLVGLFTVKCENNVGLKQLLIVPLSVLSGLCGSLLDSLLGATIQFSGFCTVRNKVVGKPGPTVKKISGLDILDNNAVNVVSILLTSLLTSAACMYLF